MMVCPINLVVMSVWWLQDLAAPCRTELLRAFPTMRSSTALRLSVQHAITIASSAAGWRQRNAVSFHDIVSQVNSMRMLLTWPLQASEKLCCRHRLPSYALMLHVMHAWKLVRQGVRQHDFTSNHGVT